MVKPSGESYQKATRQIKAKENNEIYRKLLVMLRADACIQREISSKENR